MDGMTVTLLCVFGGLVLLAAAVALALRLADFNAARRYLLMELNRSEGEERRCYERELRRLYRELLPFPRRRGGRGKRK